MSVLLGLRYTFILPSSMLVKQFNVNILDSFGLCVLPDKVVEVGKG